MSRWETAPWSRAIRQERIACNWRQRDLAEQLGTSVLTIQRWEGGHQRPSAYFRMKLCALFGKRAEALGFVAENGGGSEETGSEVDPPGESWSLSPELGVLDKTLYINGIYLELQSSEEPKVPEVRALGSDPAQESSSRLKQVLPRLSRCFPSRRRFLMGLGGLGVAALAGGGLVSRFALITGTCVCQRRGDAPHLKSAIFHEPVSPKEREGYGQSFPHPFFYFSLLLVKECAHIIDFIIKYMQLYRAT